MTDEMCQTLLALLPPLLLEKWDGIFTFERAGRPAIEVIIDNGQMIIGSRTLDQAIAETRAETQSWAESMDAPTSFEGREVIYRTLDCCESDAAKSDDSEVSIECFLLAGLLRTVETGKVPKNGDRSPLEEICLYVALFTCDADHRWRMFHEGTLLALTENERRAFQAKHRAHIMDVTANNFNCAIDVAFLLQPAFSRAFTRDFSEALSAARQALAKIDHLEEIYREFADDECDKEPNLEYYQILNEAEAMLNKTFSPVFNRYMDEWSAVVIRAIYDPESLGFQPAPSAFLD
jgi:hypothetical protein